MPTLAAVGDVRIYRPEPHTALAHVREIIRTDDVTFCQSESSYSKRGSQGSSGPRGAAPIDYAGYPAFASLGFDVVSMASNHALDWGQDPLIDSIESMTRDGMQVIGAGRDILEARRPAIIEREGATLAMLGYCSVAPKGYYAVPGRAGVAPMRAVTHYEPVEEDQPGTPCKIMTFPVERDLEALVKDVAEAKQRADVVIVSLHWGVHFIRGLIADYQPVVAHAAIDAGADAIIGHHPHILKGIEFYQGKPIFYSIGDFARDFNRERKHDPDWRRDADVAYAVWGTALGAASTSDSQGALKESLYSMIARIGYGSNGVDRVSFRPVVIEKAPEGPQPRVVPAQSPEGRAVHAFAEEISVQAGFNTSFRVEGAEIVVSPSRANA